MSGQKFLGWFTAASGGDEVTKETVPTGNATYYAHYEQVNYTVTFDVLDGEFTVPTSTTVTVPADTVLDSLPEARKTGYTFDGWYTDVDGGGDKFVAGETSVYDD